MTIISKQWKELELLFNKVFNLLLYFGFQSLALEVMKICYIYIFSEISLLHTKYFWSGKQFEITILQYYDVLTRIIAKEKKTDNNCAIVKVDHWVLGQAHEIKWTREVEKIKTLPTLWWKCWSQSSPVICEQYFFCHKAC